ncbi:MAG: right-handed parallel beta-helix repeat-containing protein, partial [Desulfobacteraceae bacterium]|nr:right-handed parallel beta-helix repeat-containing protein [Desulfobacteraceae bacterium]
MDSHILFSFKRQKKLAQSSTKLNQHSKYLFILMLLLISFLTPNLFAATTSGTLSGDETWSGTISITGDVTVPFGKKLTIEPGTTVIFPADSDDTTGGKDTSLSELIIYGSLVAVGDPDAVPVESGRIVFKSDSATPNSGDWGGIQVEWNIGFKTFDLQYCDISHTSEGINFIVIDGDQGATISNCSLNSTTGYGIYVKNIGTGILSLATENNLFSDIGTTAVYVFSDTASSTLTGTISYNQITSPGGHGIVFYANNTGQISGLTMDHNTITNAGSYGIYGLIRALA